MMEPSPGGLTIRQTGELVPPHVEIPQGREATQFHREGLQLIAAHVLQPGEAAGKAIRNGPHPQLCLAPTSPEKVPSTWLPRPSLRMYTHCSCPYQLPQASQGTDLRRQRSQLVVAHNEHTQGQLADVRRQRRQLVSAAARIKAVGSYPRRSRQELPSSLGHREDPSGQHVLILGAKKATLPGT